MLFQRRSAFLAEVRIFIIERVAVGAADFDDGLGQGIDPFARANVISKAALTEVYPKLWTKPESGVLFL